jgi:hypothetical protein
MRHYVGTGHCLFVGFFCGLVSVLYSQHNQPPLVALKLIVLLQNYAIHSVDRSFGNVSLAVTGLTPSEWRRFVAARHSLWQLNRSIFIDATNQASTRSSSAFIHSASI